MPSGSKESWIVRTTKCPVCAEWPGPHQHRINEDESLGPVVMLRVPDWSTLTRDDVRGDMDLTSQACGSLWEGCLCWKQPGHPDLHECIASECGDTWTTEQADEWWKNDIEPIVKGTE